MYIIQEEGSKWQYQVPVYQCKTDIDYLNQSLKLTIMSFHAKFCPHTFKVLTFPNYITCTLHNESPTIMTLLNFPFPN